jgi:predicted signal transduction protein with EAL and GGDEF domain
LAAAVGTAGTVARLGGDEFGLLLCPIPDPAAATRLADRLCEVLREPLELDSMTLRVDASVGIALAPDHGTTAEALLQKADIAMYEAKRSHRDWEVYSADRDQHTLERLKLLEGLRGAIEQDELVLHYQPIVDLVTQEVTAVEALVRWQHPTRGLLYPNDFLEHIEQSGLIGPLAMDVLNKALSQQEHWALAGHQLRISVNLSAANLRDEQLVTKVAEALARHRVRPESLIFEITEDCFMADAEQSVRVLEGLRSLGIELSVDDYGTGFSSLTYLRQLPVSELKLDRTFLAGAPADARAVAIIRSTIDLAHALGLRVVAEGIESEDALTLLTELGSDCVQGFLLGRPVPAADLLPTIRSRSIPGLGARAGDEETGGRHTGGRQPEPSTL